MGRKSERKGSHKSEVSTDHDLEFDCDIHFPSLIPDGLYQVVFQGAEKKYLWGHQKIFLWFQIIDFGEFQGVELYMACNAPKKGKKGQGASHKYYQAWVLAAGRKPDRFDKMSTKVFRGMLFLAKVRAVIKDAKNIPRPLPLQYSIIENLHHRLTDSEKA